MKQDKFDQLLAKVEEMKKGKEYDLSLEEDLSLGVMNLISLEEHFFFSGEKTGKEEYFEMMKQVREMRKELMKRMIPEYEGEAWCVCKHLLSATMRMIEVGTKLQSNKKAKEAKEMFDKAYKTFNLFWAVRLKLINLKGVKALPVDKREISLDDLVTQLLDCCKE